MDNTTISVLDIDTGDVGRISSVGANIGCHNTGRTIECERVKIRQPFPIALDKEHVELCLNSGSNLRLGVGLHTSSSDKAHQGNHRLCKLVHCLECHDGPPLVRLQDL